MAIKRIMFLQYFISNTILFKGLDHRHLHFRIEVLSEGEIPESKVSLIIN